MNVFLRGRLSRGQEQAMALRVGDAAPDFELPAVEGEREFRVKLNDFRGKKYVVLTFHPLDWTPT
jgi:peroxiredoxin